MSCTLTLCQTQTTFHPNAFVRSTVVIPHHEHRTQCPPTTVFTHILDIRLQRHVYPCSHRHTPPSKNNPRTCRSYMFLHRGWHPPIRSAHRMECSQGRRKAIPRPFGIYSKRWSWIRNVRRASSITGKVAKRLSISSLSSLSPEEADEVVYLVSFQVDLTEQPNAILRQLWSLIMALGLLQFCLCLHLLQLNAKLSYQRTPSPPLRSCFRQFVTHLYEYDSTNIQKHTW